MITTDQLGNDIGRSPKIHFDDHFRRLINGMMLEFGVASGNSIKRIAERLPTETIYGFDSFKGLPEEWNGLPVGEFGCPIPIDLPKNVCLIVGMFQDTLPKFLIGHSRVVSFVHIDCDLYSSTRFVLTQLKDRLRPGSTLLFDEIYTYPGWEKYEARAFVEFLNETGFGYDCIGQHGEDKAAFRLV